MSHRIDPHLLSLSFRRLDSTIPDVVGGGELSSALYSFAFVDMSEKRIVGGEEDSAAPALSLSGLFFH